MRKEDKAKVRAALKQIPRIIERKIEHKPISGYEYQKINAAIGNEITTIETDKQYLLPEFSSEEISLRTHYENMIRTIKEKNISSDKIDAYIKYYIQKQTKLYVQNVSRYPTLYHLRAETRKQKNPTAENITTWLDQFAIYLYSQLLVLK